MFSGVSQIAILTFVITTLLLLLFADPVVAEVDVGEGELDDVLYGNGAEVMLTNVSLLGENLS